MEVWNSGDALQACRRGDVCLKRSGAREARCEPGDAVTGGGVEA